MDALIAEWRKIGREFGPALPGLALVTAVAIASRLLYMVIPWDVLKKAVSEVLIAVILGLLIRNYIGFGKSVEPGIKFALQRVLRLGIILLGLRLSLQAVVQTGVSALLLVLVCMSVALTLAYVAGRFFNIPPRLAALIGVGTAICGNSAIIATAPVIEAKDEDVSFAVATITLFGTLAIILYPLIGHALALTNGAFGMWAGSAVNDTSQVVATGSAFSDAARDVATVVKLVRNTMMAPLIVIIGLLYSRASRRQLTGKAAAAARLSPGKLVPWFVLGFLILTLVRTLGVAAGVLPAGNSNPPANLKTATDLLNFIDEIAKFAILMALSGIGLGTKIEDMRRTGAKPFIVGLCVAAVLATLSLSLILFFGLGGAS
jgi:uncharacterized integral membrane protein (TIGR00698 family)